MFLTFLSSVTFSAKASEVIEKGSQKYNLIKEIHIDEMIKYVFDFEGQPNILGFTNFHSMANSYLLNIGLSQTEINQLQSKFCTLNASF